MTQVVLGNLLLTVVGASFGAALVAALIGLKIRQFISLQDKEKD